MSGETYEIHVVVRQVDDGPRPGEVIDRIGRHGGVVVVDEGMQITVGFAAAPDAVAYAGSLVDDTASSPRSVAVGIGESWDAGVHAIAASPGAVLASRRIESASRGRLSCGLSFRHAPTPDGGTFDLIVPGNHERFKDVE